MPNCPLLDGRALAARLAVALAARAEAIELRRGQKVGLGMILVGEDAASQIYVRNKARAAARVGIASQVAPLPASATAEHIGEQIDAYNVDDAVDAFLLQLPLPLGLDAMPLVARVRADKDADGLHPLNAGRAQLGLPGPRPCTPLGCMHLLRDARVPLVGARAVVIGRSAIVGQPMATMLSQADATVTICHARTRWLREHVREADILVVAAGVVNLVHGDWLKPGAAVIDVGINRIDVGEGRTRVTGDVHFDSARRVAGCITPVPGGVGPMTLAMLLENATAAAERRECPDGI